MRRTAPNSQAGAGRSLTPSRVASWPYIAAMPSHQVGSLALIPYRKLAFVAAGSLAATEGCLQLLANHGDPRAVVSAGVQLAAMAAVFWCATALNTVGGGRDNVRLAGYVFSLVAVFGVDMIGGVLGWIWLPACRLGAGVGADTVSLVIRLVQASLSLCLAMLFLHAAGPGPRRGRIGEVPAGWIVVVGASFAFALAGISSELVALPEPWCKAITAAGAAPHYKVLLDLAAGPQEEIVFTGIALLLLSGTGWRMRCAAVATSAVARGLLHLYYADHRTVWAWMFWAGVWSGGGLLLAFAAARLAARVNIGPRYFAITYTTGIVVAHSLTDMTARPLVAPFLVVGVAFVAVGIGAWWPIIRRRLDGADMMSATDLELHGDPPQRAAATD